MTRLFLISLLSASTMALSTPVMAQTTSQPTPSTDQTDQSEEDWRRSRRKSGTSDIYRTPNTNSSGFGTTPGEFEPLDPIDTLPRESRRHVMRERARAIAESDDGTISQAEYEPSDAAQNDESLARQEQEAWDDLVADSQRGSDAGSASQPSDPSADPADGSQSGQSQSGPDNSGGGQSPQGAQSGSQDQGPEQGQQPGQSSPRGGSSKSLQEIMNSIKSGQSGSSGQSGDQGQGQGQPQDQSASSQNGSPSAGGGQSGDQGQSGSDGGSSANGEGQSGDQGNQGGNQGDAGQQDSNGPPAPSLSPLDYLRQTRNERTATGQTRSASDYLQSGD